MKITSINIENVLGIRRVDLRIDAPVLVVAGKNAAGKSSLGEAIRLAMLAQHDRVELKKHLGLYVNDKAQAGAIVLDMKGEAPYSVHVTNGGNVTDSRKGQEAPYALQYTLNPSTFAMLDPKTRRAALFRILGLNLTPDAVKARLLAKGCAEAKVDAVAPMFRAGFEAACKHAQSNTSDARGAWKATTGETYGNVKAATWRAECPTFTGEQAAELHRLDGAIASAEAELADAQKRLAIADHEAEKRERREAEVTRLRESAKAFAYHADLVQRAEKDVAELQASLTQAEQKAGTKPVEWHSKLTCPHCKGAVMDSEDGESLVAWADPPEVVYDAEAAARLPALQKALTLQQTVLNRHIGNRDIADQAAKQLLAIEAGEPAKVDAPEPIRQTVQTLRTSIDAMKAKQADLAKTQAALDAADEKTKDARKHHRDVEEWTAIAAALSPDGIPAEILAEALGPINERLAQSAEDTTWPAVSIDADMTIALGGRLYDFCSESEKWRVDAMIAEAISYLSGLRILLLERFDVLDLPSRGQALAWLDVLASNDEVETAIVLATLKARPALPDTMQAVWIERGQIAHEREAVAA